MAGQYQSMDWRVKAQALAVLGPSNGRLVVRGEAESAAGPRSALNSSGQGALRRKPGLWGRFSQSVSAFS